VAVRKDFGLTYRDKDNSNKTPLCIHRAPLGTHERFIGFLIEHYAGNCSLWLAPDQVRVITLNDDEALINYAKPIVAELRANRVRVDADFSATPFKAKIANAVAQTGSLPCRKLATCVALSFSNVSVLATLCRLPVGDTADYQSALQRHRRSRPGSRRGERASPPRRPARREGEGGGRGGYSGGHQRK